SWRPPGDEDVSLSCASGSMFRRCSKDTASLQRQCAKCHRAPANRGLQKRIKAPGTWEAKMPLTWVIDHQARMVVATGADTLRLEDFDAAMDELARPATLSYRKLVDLTHC